MKRMKKIVGILLAMVMVVAMAGMVFADSTVTISAPEGSTRTYDVYQIFTGDLSNGILSNVKWGQNAKLPTNTKIGDAVDQTVLDALTAVNSSSETEKLGKIETYVNLDSSAIGRVSANSPLNVPTGYYLIKDNGPVGDEEGYSLYVVEVVGPTTISPKTGTTTSKKKVDDKNDSNTDEDTTVWQDSADYDIGDAVPFQLKATIASDYDNYAHGYKLTFHDKEESGLTFDSNSVKVYVDGTEIATGFQVVTTGLTDGDTFEVRFENLKNIGSVKAGSVITVEYTSTLNKNAVIGSTGNKNTSHITYTNNPNDEQAGENGTTPDDTVIVFTYQVVVNKVTENPDYVEAADDEGSEKYIPLAGAGFTLYKKVANSDYDKEAEGSEEFIYELVKEIGAGTATKFTFSGLDDGEYKLSETTTPAGYNTIADIEFKITAEHEVLSDSPALTSLNGNAATGTVATFTADTTNSSLSTDVENKKGSTLPETGGIGTTIFYVVGTILVLGAALVLITKKRMSAQK